ncbi:MAG: hypothetical protein K0Q49_198 [Haloplasmataceae bacterium]|nr:hypothetical protein [Haloplasmataceae bacterium]
MIKKGLLMSIGSIAVILGLIGIILPILPTTPFLLLGAACFFRSSNKMYKLLINNRYLGVYIKNYQEKKGIPLKIKISVITFLWISIIYSAFFVLDQLILRIIILSIAIIVTYHILKQNTFNENYK